MCRLLGIIANKDVDIKFSFFEAKCRFKNLSWSNPDGWGIGYYDSGKPKVYKQGAADVINAPDDYNFPKVKDVLSKIIICHVRKATVGEKKEVNAHPFKYENWIFAHNGSVSREFLLEHLEKKYKNKIDGTTDSEAYFLLLMQEVYETGDPVKGIETAVKLIKNKCDYYRGLNFILSDGQTLYAYRSAPENKDYYSLYIHKRDQSDGVLSYQSQETKLLLESKALAGEKAVLICSEKLTNEDWKEIKPDRLVVINSNLGISEHLL